jgi:hypothetical protein
MVQATIVHHNGSGTVEDFEQIIEMDDGQTLRVFYKPEEIENGFQMASGPDGLVYETYHYASVVEVDASDEDVDGGADRIIS